MDPRRQPYYQNGSIHEPVQQTYVVYTQHQLSQQYEHSVAEPGRKRKRDHHSPSKGKVAKVKLRRMKANDRERSRMHSLNDALGDLRNTMPDFGQTRHNLSKIDTLRLSANYINLLKEMLLSNRQLSAGETALMLCKGLSQAAANRIVSKTLDNGIGIVDNEFQNGEYHTDEQIFNTAITSPLVIDDLHVPAVECRKRRYPGFDHDSPMTQNSRNLVFSSTDFTMSGQHCEYNSTDSDYWCWSSDIQQHQPSFIPMYHHTDSGYCT